MESGNTLKAKVNKHSLVKPSEFIDVVALTPLKLHDKQLFNELLGNAWEYIGSGKEHTIHKNDIVAIDKNQDRLKRSIVRLQSVVLKQLVKRKDDDEEYERTFNFLVKVDNAIKKNGLVHYQFSPEAVKMMLDSNVFARIQREIMFALSSKYSLALYEILAKRKNLKHIDAEFFDLSAFRSILGVGENKYKVVAHLRSRILDTAFGEVSQLTDIGCAYELIRKNGKAFSHIRVSWWSKDPRASYDAQNKRNMPKKQQILDRKNQSEVLRLADKEARKYRKQK